MKVKTIAILGAGGSAGINFTKSLRLCGEKFNIIGCDINKFYLELSNADTKYFLPHESISEYVDRLNNLIKKEKIEFLHAQPDSEVKIISDNRNKLSASTFLPSKEAINIAQDKWETYKILTERNVPVPKTFLLNNKKQLERAFEEIEGTIWLRASKGAGGKASLPTTKMHHAEMWIDYWIERGLNRSDFLASEFLPGIEVSWLSLWKEGELICSQGKLRIDWSHVGLTPSGVTGTTAIQETVHNSIVNKLATDSVYAIDKNPNGIYVVDLKENRAGIPCVTEINPGRFFTTSYFFSNCGVNFPHIFIKLAYNEVVPKHSKYNCVPKGIFWIRAIDGGHVLIKNKNEFQEMV